MFGIDVFMATTPEQIFYGYGPVGVVAVIVSFVAWKMFNILLKDRDKAINDRDTMTEDLFTKVIPAVSRSTEVLERRQDLDKELIKEIKESKEATLKNTEILGRIELYLLQGRPVDSSGGKG